MITRRTTPMRRQGAVVAFNNHGTLLYLNQAQLDAISRRETWSSFNGFVCTFLLVAMVRSSVGNDILRGKARIAFVVPVLLGAASFFYWSTRV